MGQSTNPGQPPSDAKEHDRPTVVDVRAGPPPRDESSATERPPVPPGMGPQSRLGDYELLREIGRGGMGVVFQARHLRLNRVVALKMILGGALAPPEDLHRFDTEVAAAAQLQHPGIVALYEVSTRFEQPYFSMEYISGSSLAQRLALGPMANRRAAAYMEAVARAVHHAHVRGIVHRDLKPANILLDEHDQPKVTDFGLAKLLATDSGQTRTGAVLGTPSYMSPEQGAGQRAIGPPSDVWSLGAILYELLTGRPPFRGETAMATLQQVAHKDPVPPRLFDPAISPDLETICLKCLEKEPARRYYSAEALADDLRRFLREEPILARPVPAFARIMSWARRKPAQALTAGGALAAVVLFTLFLFISSYEERRLRNEAEKAERLAQIREEAMRHLLYLAEMRRAQQALEQADFDRVQRLLKHWEPREGERDLRDWEWHFLRTHSQGPHSVHAHAYQASAVAWRPDGKQIATAGGEPSKPGEIKIWDATAGKLLATMQGHKLAITSLAWHPHKNLLASGSFDKTVRLWDITLHKELATLTGHRAEVKSVAFAPGGDRLASGSRDKSIRIWNVDQALTGKTEPRMLRGHEADVTAVAFAPHGDVLASASADKTVRLWSLATMSEQHVLRGHDGPVSCLAFGPEATFLASGGGQGSQRGEVTLWNAQTGQRIAVRFGLSNRVTSLSCNSSGVLAAGVNDGFVHIWNQAQTSEGQTFRGDKQVLYLAFSPDGRQLAVAGVSGRVSFFNSSGSLETLRLSATTAVEAVAFSNVAPLVAIAGRQGSLNVWNLDHPGGPIPYAGHAGTIMSAAFSAGGKLLASSGEDGKILIHDVTLPDQPPIVLDGHGGPVRALAFVNESLLASASDDDTVRLWDLDAKVERRSFQHGNSVRALAVSADRRWLASGGVDKVVYLWELQTGEVSKLTGHTGTINALAFSPDSQQLISGSSDRTIRAWSVAGKQAEQGPDGLNTPVLALAYHPGGRRFASLGQDKTIRLWDVITRQEILELDDPIATPRALAFSHDGRWLAAGSGNSVRLWDSGRSFAQN